MNNPQLSKETQSSKKVAGHRYQISKHFRFYGNPFYDDDLYGRDRIRAKHIDVYDVPLFYGDIDYNKLADCVTDCEYFYIVSAKEFHGINGDGDTLH